MLTVSVTTLRTGALELAAPAPVGAGGGITAGDTLACASGPGTGAGLTCTGAADGAGAGGGVLGLLRGAAGLASGAGTTLLMTLPTREKGESQNRAGETDEAFKNISTA